MKVCLVRYSEIGLKGRNLPSFENLLIKNIKANLIKNKIKFSGIKKTHKKILIYTNDVCDFLKNIFGVASFSHAVECELDMDEIKKTIFGLVKKTKFKKFRVSATRANKKFQYISPQINIIVGDLIKNKLNKKVDLKNFELNIGIDVLDKAYVFIDKVKGLGGLPLGIEGRVIVLIGDKNSLLAAYLMMKRGCKVIPFAYKKFNINLLKKFDYSLRLKIVKGAIKEDDVKAIVVGQTLKNIKEIKTNLVVLRPLVGLSKKEIRAKLNYLEKT